MYTLLFNVSHLLLTSHLLPKLEMFRNLYTNLCRSSKRLAEDKRKPSRCEPEELTNNYLMKQRAYKNEKAGHGNGTNGQGYRGQVTLYVPAHLDGDAGGSSATATASRRATPRRALITILISPYTDHASYCYLHLTIILIQPGVFVRDDV